MFTLYWRGMSFSQRLLVLVPLWISAIYLGSELLFKMRPDLYVQFIPRPKRILMIYAREFYSDADPNASAEDYAYRIKLYRSTRDRLLTDYPEWLAAEAFELYEASYRNNSHPLHVYIPHSYYCRYSEACSFCWDLMYDISQNEHALKKCRSLAMEKLREGYRGESCDLIYYLMPDQPDSIDITQSYLDGLPFMPSNVSSESVSAMADKLNWRAQNAVKKGNPWRIIYPGKTFSGGNKTVNVHAELVMYLLKHTDHEFRNLAYSILLHADIPSDTVIRRVVKFAQSQNQDVNSVLLHTLCQEPLIRYEAIQDYLLQSTTWLKPHRFRKVAVNLIKQGYLPRQNAAWWQRRFELSTSPMHKYFLLQLLEAGHGPTAQLEQEILACSPIKDADIQACLGRLMSLNDTNTCK